MDYVKGEEQGVRNREFIFFIGLLLRRSDLIGSTKDLAASYFG